MSTVNGNVICIDYLFVLFAFLLTLWMELNRSYYPIHELKNIRGLLNNSIT